MISASGAESPALNSEPSIYDKVWRYVEWYRNEDNPVIQGFDFTGRFQLDYAVVDSDQGDHNEWNIRRFRLGGRATLFHEFTLHGEVELDPQEEVVYERLTSIYLAWSRNDSFKLTLGKQNAPFTLDGSTSSKELLTMDRNNLANNLWFSESYMPGITVSGRPNQWRYFAGVYSSGAANKEFGEFNGGFFLLSSLGYDFAHLFNVRRAELKADYVYQDPDVNNTFTRNLQHVGSLNFSFDTVHWGFRTDISAAAGYSGQSDLWGATIMPFYNITDKFQAVGRYTYLHSAESNGLRLNTYENRLVAGLGDEYNEVYLGLNYYFYGHKLKVQTGVQYAEMQDRANDGGRYSGWAWATGLRIAW